MAITFYCGSGSPFAWKVWFVLEHKKLAYDLKVLSFGAGDHKKPDFLAINPRGKLPALVEDGVRLYESSAIVEYLEDAHPEPTVLPGDAATRALARRIAVEADDYLHAAVSRLVAQTLFKPKGDGDPSEIVEAKKGVEAELARFETYAERELLAGNAVSLADFATYPEIAFLKRIADKQPANTVALPAKLAAWAKRIEALPYFGRTVPPHWKMG
jgi:glutathione S-transferase